jgi:superfamily II DNA or RNA helicase
MITLREDQEDVRAKLRVALRTHGSVLAYAPTGFGKTVLASALIKLITDAGKRVIFACHRLALLKQTAVTLEGFGLPYSYIAAGYHHNVYRKINIASIDTLKNRLGKHPAEYLFIDEAHLSASSGWAKVVAHYKAQGTKIIGLSGSPIRLDGKPLGAVWDTMVMGPSVQWLIDQGFLSKFRAFAPAGIDVSALHTRNGEYVSSEVEDLIAGKAVMAGAVRHWRNYAVGKRTIAFAPSIKRAQEMAAEFTANGHVFVALDANTPQADRDRAFLALADRQIDGLVNCNLFSEGFDMSAQVGRDVPIECVLDLYPTQSLARHLQKHGRGLRRKPEPAVLLDLVGGFARLGLPNEDREWSLEGKANGAVKAKQEERVRQCPSCFAAHDPAPTCPECGHVYVAADRKINEVEGELAEVDQEAVRAARKQQDQQAAWALARKIKAGEIDDPKLANEVKFLMNTVTAKKSKHPAKWAARVLTARLAKRQGAAV